MPVQDNHPLVRRFYEEIWNSRKMEVAKDIIHENYTSDEKIGFSAIPGIRHLTDDVDFYHKMYSNLKFKIELMIINKDVVMTTWKATGESTEESFTNRRGEVQPKSLQSTGMSLTRIADGKIIENTLYWSRRPLFP